MDSSTIQVAHFVGLEVFADEGARAKRKNRPTRQLALLSLNFSQRSLQ